MSKDPIDAAVSRLREIVLFRMSGQPVVGDDTNEEALDRLLASCESPPPTVAVTEAGVRRLVQEMQAAWCLGKEAPQSPIMKENAERWITTALRGSGVVVVPGRYALAKAMVEDERKRRPGAVEDPMPESVWDRWLKRADAVRTAIGG